MDLHGTVAVVTGASRGIGRQLATDLAADGARVVLLARNKPDLDAAAAAITGRGGAATTTVCDVSDRTQVEAAARQVLDEYGRIDVLATCAAIAPSGSVLDAPPDNLEEVLRVNLLGTMWCCRTVAPIMSRQGRGEIVTFSSHSGRLPMPGQAAYCATKAGVAAFSEALHTELRDRGVHVFTVYPGVVAETDLARADIAARGAPPRAARMTAAQVSAAIRQAFGTGRSQVALPKRSAALHVLRALAPTLTLHMTAR